MEFIGGILFFAALISSCLALVGLIKPALVKAPSRWKAFLYYTVTSFFLAFIAGAMLPKTPGKAEKIEVAAVEKPGDKKPAEPTFNLTLPQFIERFNKAQTTLKRQIVINPKPVPNNGEKNMTSLETSSDLLGFLVETDEAGKVTVITLITTGSGTISSGLDVVMNMVGLIMAIEDPTMDVDGRHGIATDLGLTESEPGKDFLDHKFIRNRTFYSISKSDSLGIWMVAAPKAAVK